MLYVLNHILTLRALLLHGCAEILVWSCPTFMSDESFFSEIAAKTSDHSDKLYICCVSELMCFSCKCVWCCPVQLNTGAPALLHGCGYLLVHVLPQDWQ